MSLPDPILEIIGDYALPHFDKPLIEVEPFVPFTLISKEEKQGLILGEEEDEKILRKIREASYRENEEEDEDLRFGILFGLINADRDFNIIEEFMEPYIGEQEIKENLVYNAIMYGHYDLALKLMKRFEKSGHEFNRDLILDNLMLKLPSSKIPGMISKLDIKDYPRYLLLFLQRGDWRSFRWVKKQSSDENIISAVREILKKGLPSEQERQVIFLLTSE